MAEARQRPIDEILFGAPPPPAPPPEASLAEVISAWYRAQTGKRDSQAGTRRPSGTPPPGPSHKC